MDAVTNNNENQNTSPFLKNFEYFSKFLTVFFVIFTFSNTLTKTKQTKSTGSKIIENEQSNNQLTHKSVIKLLNLSNKVDLLVFITNHETFEWSADTMNEPVVVFSNIILDWTFNNSFKPYLFNVSVDNYIVNNNVSIYAHVFTTNEYPNTNSALVKHPLNDSLVLLSNDTFPLYKKKSKKIDKKLRNLLYSNGTDFNETNQRNEIQLTTYIVPNFDLSLVLGIPEFPYSRIPTDIQRKLKLSPNGCVYPELYWNEFWTTSKQLKEVNSTTDSITISITYSHISFWLWHMQLTMEEQWKTQRETGLGGSDKETDTLREILLETNPYLLAITAIVTVLHTLFDILAFKNDIQFWRNKKDLKGLSIKTIFINCFFQSVILLYLYDNETSYMILVSSTINLCIEYWKLTKTLLISVEYRLLPIGISIPYIKVNYLSSYENTITSKNDNVAINHMLYIIIPLMIGYALYTLNFNEYKSFYSWFINIFVGFIYLFGFILMIPQLYINYQLKSVAHMPWKSMIYKFLNTFIDDLFAFIIKMPWLHRLACFRDDIIFFIYLYQRWIYRIDYSRTNEFGQGGEESLDENSSVSNIDISVSENKEKNE